MSLGKVFMSDSKELVNLISRPYESKEHDFKGPMKWDEKDKKSCCEIVKDILALANTKGGFIVIGVEENTTGFNQTGLTLEQFASFETSRINRFVQRYADPPINTTLTKIEHNGKSFVIIGVPQFNSVPHICAKDFQGVLTKPTIYVRTDNNESAPLGNSSDFQALIESAIQNREQRLLSAIRSILKGHDFTKEQKETLQQEYEKQISTAVNAFEGRNPLKGKNYTGYREVTFFSPTSFDAKRYEIPKLKEALKKASVDFRGWPFIFVSRDSKDLYVIQDGIESLVEFPDFKGNDRIDFWRIYTSGLFYHRCLMWEESQDRKRRPATIDISYVNSKEYKGSTMDFVALTFYVAEAVNSLTLLYTALEIVDEPITARFRLLGADDRMLTTSDTGRHLSMAYISRVPEIIEERTFSLNEWKAGVIDLSIDIIRCICLKFNWENPSTSVFKIDIERLFNRTL